MLPDEGPSDKVCRINYVLKRSLADINKIRIVNCTKIRQYYDIFVFIWRIATLFTIFKLVNRREQNGARAF